MVGCSSQRCLQERRIIKKELLQWNKKVPVIVGLEQVADLLVGPRTMRQLLAPLSAADPIQVVDWEPNLPCKHCSEQRVKTSEVETSDNTSSAPGTAPSHSLGYPGVCRYNSPTVGDDPSGLNKAACYLDQQDEIYLDQPLDLSSSGVHSNSNPEDDECDSKTTQELRIPTLDAKLSRKKGDYSGNKRSYTMDELAAAVSDIRSGKLGTRRAAALYGIPRSTLRNKIFRMENQRRCDTKLAMSDLLQGMAGGYTNKAPKTPPIQSVFPHLGSDPHNSFEDMTWEGKFAQLRRKHDFNAGLERPFGVPPLFYNSCHMLECEKAFRWADPYSYEHKLPFLHSLIRKFTHQRVAELERIHHQGHAVSPLEMSGGHCRSNRAPNSEGRTSPIELKVPSFRPLRQAQYSSACSPNTPLSINTECNPRELDMVGRRSDFPNSPRNISASLQGVISKSLSQESSGNTTNGMRPGFLPTYYNSDMPYEDDVKRFKSRRNSESPRKKESNCYDSPDQRDNLQDESEGHDDDKCSENKPKKTRPKRGQYRKYNSQLLVEAVKAVQRGEMSVHRAGSYFGVPHSTLEYKVKERHLLRQKKPRGDRKKGVEAPPDEQAVINSRKGLPSDKVKSCSSTSSNGAPSLKVSPVFSSSEQTRPSTSSLRQPSSSSSSSSSGVVPHSVGGMMPDVAADFPLGLPAPPPGLLSWPAPAINTPSLPLPDPNMAAYMTSGGFAINTSASDLLKKLQRKVEANAELAFRAHDLMTSGTEARHSRKRRRSSDHDIKREQCSSQVSVN